MKKQSIYFLVIIILLVQTSCQQNNNEEDLFNNKITLLENNPQLYLSKVDSIQVTNLNDEKEATHFLLVSLANHYITYIIHSGFISGYQNRYGDNLKPPTNVYHRMTA